MNAREIRRLCTQECPFIITDGCEWHGTLDELPDHINEHNLNNIRNGPTTRSTRQNRKK